MMQVINHGTGRLNLGVVKVLGVPFDGESSYLRGSAMGPSQIRESFYNPSTNLCAENGIDLGNSKHWSFVDDLDFSGASLPGTIIESGAEKILAEGSRLVALGGDHSITYPLMRAQAKFTPGLSVLHLDAHPDLYDEFEGNRLSHACPFARIMEEGLVKRLVQLGIRTLTPHQREQAQRFGVEIIPASAWHSAMELDLTPPIYLSLDLDVLDPAFAPGVSHHEPGGLSSREVIGIIQKLEAPLVGATLWN